jgi:uncharacterized protein involved in exopolysaccharide biosynthesis
MMDAAQLTKTYRALQDMRTRAQVQCEQLDAQEKAELATLTAMGVTDVDAAIAATDSELEQLSVRAGAATAELRKLGVTLPV